MWNWPENVSCLTRNRKWQNAGSSPNALTVLGGLLRESDRFWESWGGLVAGYSVEAGLMGLLRPRLPGIWWPSHSMRCLGFLSGKRITRNLYWGWWTCTYASFKSINEKLKEHQDHHFLGVHRCLITVFTLPVCPAQASEYEVVISSRWNPLNRKKQLFPSKVKLTYFHPHCYSTLLPLGPTPKEEGVHVGNPLV